jgi:hypothetical protein
MRLHQCFVALAQLNTNADDTVNWCANSLTKENADKIKQN